jgi:hypothetical protein
MYARRFLSNSRVTNGAFEFVCGEIFGHIMTSVFKSNWLNVVNSMLLFYSLGVCSTNPSMLIDVSVQHQPITFETQHAHV